MVGIYTHYRFMKHFLINDLILFSMTVTLSLWHVAWGNIVRKHTEEVNYWGTWGHLKRSLQPYHIGNNQRASAEQQLNTGLTTILPLLLTIYCSCLPTRPRIAFVIFSPCFSHLSLYFCTGMKWWLHKQRFPACFVSVILLSRWPWRIVLCRLQVFVQPLPRPRMERYVQRLLRVWCDPL